MEKQCTHKKCVERSITFPNGCSRFPDIMDCGSHRIENIRQKYSEEYAKKEASSDNRKYTNQG